MEEVCDGGLCEWYVDVAPILYLSAVMLCHKEEPSSELSLDAIFALVDDALDKIDATSQYHVEVFLRELRITPEVHKKVRPLDPVERHCCLCGVLEFAAFVAKKRSTLCKGCARAEESDDASGAV